MINLPFEQRLASWRDFRLTLETAEDPIQDCIDYWRMTPEVSFQADPYDQLTWPDPWQMIEENIYCEFVKILAILYTLQLTDRFSQCNFEIHIKHNTEESTTQYLLFVDDRVVGFRGDTHVAQSELPKNLESQQSYTMSPLQ